MCQFCGYKSGHIGNMHKHIMRRHLNIQYPCTLCNKTYPAEENRKVHYRREHHLTLSYEEIRCLKNSKFFLSVPFPGNFEEYYTRLGSGSILCQVCGYSTTRLGNMTKHISRRHLVGNDYQCTFCDRSFKAEEDRRKHYIRTHDMTLSCGEIRNLKKFPNIPN